MASKVFEESNYNLDGVALRNPNAVHEAFIYESICSLPDEEKEKFCDSPIAQELISQDVINQEFLVNLKQCGHRTKEIEILACDAAKDAGDELWGQLVEARVAEREILNQIMTKYAEQVAKSAVEYHDEYIKNKIPDHF